MKVSIVTVVFNSVSVIEETILSVIYQKNASLEYIVIDGNSTDGTQNNTRIYNRLLLNIL